MSVEQDAKLTEDVNRILAAIAHVVRCASEYGSEPTQYDIVKALFLADRSHLNEWGRPVTYDNYVAMKHGPVASLAYDFLKGNDFAFQKHHVTSVPWRRSDAGRGKYHFHPLEGGEQDAYRRYLSRSDREALEAACGTVLKMGFGKVRMLTHEDPAYKEAWREDGDRGRYDMDLALFFDEPNPEAAQEIAEYSKYVRAG